MVDHRGRRAEIGVVVADVKHARVASVHIRPVCPAALGDLHRCGLS